MIVIVGLTVMSDIQTFHKSPFLRLFFLVNAFISKSQPPAQLRVAFDTFHLVVDDGLRVGLYAVVVALDLLRHHVVAVLVTELVDYRDFHVGTFLRADLGVVYHDFGVENLLVYLLAYIVGNGTDERALRQVGYFGGGYELVELGVYRGRHILTVYRDGLPLLQDFAETLGEGFRSLAHHLSAEDVADSVLDNLRLLFTVVAVELREVLEAEAYRLSLILLSDPTSPDRTSYAVFCLSK